MRAGLYILALLNCLEKADTLGVNHLPHLAMEIIDCQCWCMYPDVAVAVDALLKGAFWRCLRSSSTSVYRRHSSLTLGSEVVMAIREHGQEMDWVHLVLGLLSACNLIDEGGMSRE